MADNNSSKTYDIPNKKRIPMMTVLFYCYMMYVFNEITIVIKQQKLFQTTG